MPPSANFPRICQCLSEYWTVKTCFFRCIYIYTLLKVLHALGMYCVFDFFFLSLQSCARLKEHRAWKVLWTAKYIGTLEKHSTWKFSTKQLLDIVSSRKYDQQYRPFEFPNRVENQYTWQRNLWGKSWFCHIYIRCCGIRMKISVSVCLHAMHDTCMTHAVSLAEIWLVIMNFIKCYVSGGLTQLKRMSSREIVI